MGKTSIRPGTMLCRSALRCSRIPHGTLVGWYPKAQCHEHGLLSVPQNGCLCGSAFLARIHLRSLQGRNKLLCLHAHESQRNPEEKLRIIMDDAIDKLTLVPEEKESILAALREMVDVWVEDTANGTVTVDLLMKIQRGDFPSKIYDAEKTGAGLDEALIHDVVECVGTQLTSYYLGYDFGSLDTMTEQKRIEPMDKVREITTGSMVPFNSIDLQLCDEQARALEATIGIQKAESLVQLLGRKSLSADEMLDIQKIPEKSDARRILEVLVTIPDRVERKELMKEAFTPVDDTPGHVAEEEEEEALWTTPMALCQEILLWKERLRRGDAIENGQELVFGDDVLEELWQDAFDTLS